MHLPHGADRRTGAPKGEQGLCLPRFAAFQHVGLHTYTQLRARKADRVPRPSSGTLKKSRPAVLRPEAFISSGYTGHCAAVEERKPRAKIKFQASSKAFLKISSVRGMWNSLLITSSLRYTSSKTSSSLVQPAGSVWNRIQRPVLFQHVLKLNNDKTSTSISKGSASMSRALGGTLCSRMSHFALAWRPRSTPSEIYCFKSLSSSSAS